MRSTLALAALLAPRASRAARALLPRADEPTIAARAEAAVLASFVCDAAAMPLHWDYDQARIARLVGGGDAAFHDPPENICARRGRVLRAPR